MNKPGNLWTRKARAKYLGAHDQDEVVARLCRLVLLDEHYRRMEDALHAMKSRMGGYYFSAWHGGKYVPVEVYPQLMLTVAYDYKNPKTGKKSKRFGAVSLGEVGPYSEVMKKGKTRRKRK